MPKPLRDRNFYAGLLFAALGLGAVVVARGYPAGTTTRMGPGYFPTALGGLLTLLGLVVAARAALRAEPMPPWAVRPLALVTGTVLAFAFLIDSLGLVVATAAVVFVGALAGREWRPREVTALYLVAVVFTVAVFVYGLGMPFRVWPV